jgi:hypothetical protein
MYYDFLLLHRKPGKHHSKSSIAQYGLTTKPTNLRYDQTTTVTAVAKKKLSSTSFANAKTTQSYFGVYLQIHGLSSSMTSPLMMNPESTLVNQYYLQHSSSPIVVHIHDEELRNALLLLVQEIKRDIVYRRMNLPPSAHQITDPRRLTAHIDSAIWRLCSYLQYIGFIKYTKASETLQRLQDLNIA